MEKPTSLRALLMVAVDRTTVRQQIAVMTGLVCFLAVSLVAGSAAWSGRQEAIMLIRQEMARVAEHMADRMDHGFYERYRELAIRASVDSLQDMWLDKPKELREVFERLQASMPSYAWIGFVTSDGIVHAATGGAREGTSFAHARWFTEGLRHPTIMDVGPIRSAAADARTFTDASVRPVVDLAFPVKNRAGETIGVLAGQVDWLIWVAGMRKRVLSIEDASGATDMWVLSATGEPLLAPPGIDDPPSDEMIAEILVGQRGSMVIDDEEGGRLVGYAGTAGYGEFRGLGWVVAAWRPVNLAYGSANRLATWILAIGGVSAVIGVAVGSLLARRLSDPIGILTQQADGVGRDGASEMIARQHGSREVVQLSSVLRSLQRRAGLAEAHAVEEADRAQQLASDLMIMRRLAETDPLTGLLNRRAFRIFADDAMSMHRRYGRPFAILMVDIDHFKRVNDTHGHAAGDAVIRRIGEIICDTIRETDRVARFGGEEFVVLLRETEADGPERFAERIRTRIAATAVSFDGRTISVSASFGASTPLTGDRDVDDLIERADQALYEAKAAGRNRVVVADGAVRAA